MLVFLAQRILGVETQPQCEDIGIRALRARYERDPASPQFAFIWLPVALATGNIEYLIASTFRRGRFPRVSLVDGISPIVIALWTFFTFCSMISLLQFGRAELSFAFKFSHVFFELVNLFIFFSLWGWSAHAATTLVLGFVGIFSALAMPCDVTYLLTSIGAVLDTANFLVVLYQYLRLRTPALLRVALAFAFHATYIWSFLIMAYGDYGEDWSIAFRTYGVYANCFAIHFGTSAVAIYRRLDADEKATRINGVYDSAIVHHERRVNYAVCTEGSILPMDRWTTAVILCASLLSSSPLVVDRVDDDGVVMHTFVIRRRVHRARWTGGIVRLGDLEERGLKAGGWLVFYAIVNLALFAGVTAWLALLVAWYAPVVVSSLLAHVVLFTVAAR